MSEPFLGQITCMANNYPPSGWLQCRGQMLPIGQYTALFSLLGTRFGGNGTTNFQLPNLQGSAPIGQGTGAGLSPRAIGQTAGETAVLLTAATTPPHNHTFPAAAQNANATVPAAGSMLSKGNTPGSGGHGSTGTPIPNFATTANPVALNAATLPPYAGGNGVHNNLQPSLALNWCIATQGNFPARP